MTALPITAPPLYPDQQTYLSLIYRTIREGAKRICAVQQTGWGKGNVIARMLADCASTGKRSAVVTHLSEINRDLIQRVRAHGIEPHVLMGSEAEGAAEGRPYLRADYEALRADYEALRRPFFATPERPYTDAWTFPTVQAYEGKHPCEKPAEMCEHAVLTSTRPGDLVVDLFCGSGAMGSAALAHGRRFLGGDADEHWADHARRRCEMTLATGRTATRSVVAVDPRQGRLF